MTAKVTIKHKGHFVIKAYNHSNVIKISKIIVRKEAVQWDRFFELVPNKATGGRELTLRRS